MEGRGVTNYSLNKPSYAFTAATTEFDDALIKRGIVTHEQAIFAKGASSEEARRLVVASKSKSISTSVERQHNTHDDTTLKEDFGESDSDLEDDDDDDDDFLQKYRQQRLAEMKQEYSNNNKDHQTCSNKSNSKQQQQHRFGDVVPIQRPDWTFHVNDASHDATVVVVLTSKDNIELTGSVEAALSILAPLCPYIKFVTIPSTSAIDNFPDNNLPIT